jgi:hypothetical protein
VQPSLVLVVVFTVSGSIYSIYSVYSVTGSQCLCLSPVSIVGWLCLLSTASSAAGLIRVRGYAIRSLSCGSSFMVFLRPFMSFGLFFLRFFYKALEGPPLQPQLSVLSVIIREAHTAQSIHFCKTRL